MPEGHWSLSTLPGNGLLVRIGLERSLRFLPGPLLNQSYVELVWTWASTMIYPWSHWSGIIFIMVYSSLPPSWGSLSVCVCEISKRHNFISHCLLWRFLRQCHQCKAESFNLAALKYTTNLVDGKRPSFSTKLFTHNSVSRLFSATGVTLKALPACPSVCCPSLFGFCSSLCCLFTISVQKCHSALSWAASAFTLTCTKHAHKCQLLKPFVKRGWWWESYLCKKLQQFTFTKTFFFSVLHIYFGETGSVMVINFNFHK